jgi:hypothetical protein
MARGGWKHSDETKRRLSEIKLRPEARVGHNKSAATRREMWDLAKAAKAAGFKLPAKDGDSK